MVPYHVQIYVRNGDIFRAFFYERNHEFELKMELPTSTLIDGGLWPSINEAADAARAMLMDLAKLPEVVRDRRILHLYIRHPRDSQSYGNDWFGDFRVRSITTYETVAQYCKTALQNGDRVRIHRRKFESFPATVCCECAVKSVEAIEGTNGFKVEFQDWTNLCVKFDKRLQQGYYFASPSSYEQTDS